MSHRLSSFSFLQCYCDYRLNEQKDKVGAQGVVWRFDSCECVLNNYIDLQYVMFDTLVCCEFVFIYFFSTCNYMFCSNSEMEKGFGKIGQNPKVYNKILQVV
jgi:hypothetical protein